MWQAHRGFADISSRQSRWFVHDGQQDQSRQHGISTAWRESVKSGQAARGSQESLPTSQIARHGGVDQPGDAAIHDVRPWSSGGSIFCPSAVIGNGKRDTVDTVLGNAGGTDDIGDGITQSLAVHFSTQ